MVGHFRSVRLVSDAGETSPNEKDSAYVPVGHDEPPPEPHHQHISHKILEHFRRIIKEELDARAPEEGRGRGGGGMSGGNSGYDGPMTGSQLRREPFGDFHSVFRNGQWHTVLAPAGAGSARSRSNERNESTQEPGASQGPDEDEAIPEEDIEHQAGETDGATTDTAKPSGEDEVKQKDENDEAKPQQEANPDHEGQKPDGSGKAKGRIPPNEVLMRSADLLNQRKTMARPDGVLTAEPALLHDLERRVEKLHGIQRTFPNPIARIRYEFREPLAEFLGVFVYMTIGMGVGCQTTLSELSGTPAGDTLSKCMAWGIATGCGIWVSGGISGGHLNPAVTLSLSVNRGLPAGRIPTYFLAQLLGAYVSTFCVYGVYKHMITTYDPDLTQTSAVAFITRPIQAVAQPATVGLRIVPFWSEVLSSAVLMVIMFAVGDAHNTPPPEGMGPMLVLWAVIGILSSYSVLDGGCLNPVRDLGPRLALWTVGYSRTDLWTYDGLAWLWCAILGPIVGMILGGIMYDTCVYQGAEALTNRPLKVPFISNTSDGRFTRWLIETLAKARVPPAVIIWFLDMDSTRIPKHGRDHPDPDEKQRNYWNDDNLLSHRQHLQPLFHSQMPSNDSEETLRPQ